MSDFSKYAAVPGTTEFLPDFFLDEFDDYTNAQKKIVENTKAPKGGVQQVFDKISTVINEEMVGKMKAVYCFDISGTFNSIFHLLITKINQLEK